MRLLDKAKAQFQARVLEWLLACFPEAHVKNKEVRNKHFLEESVELVQSLGMTYMDAMAVVAYVYHRPKGDPIQEVGGVQVTLAALCEANGLNMHDAGEQELDRIWQCIHVIRDKQKHKPH